MTEAEDVVNFVAFALSFASAFFWIKSATARVPADSLSSELKASYRKLGLERICYTSGGGTFYIDAKGKVFDHEKTLLLQSKMNRNAAILTALAVIAGAF